MCVFELRDRVLSLPVLEKKMEFFKTEIRKTERDVSDLLRQTA
jgi:hypothetical protein